MLNRAAARQFLLDSLNISVCSANRMLRMLGHDGWFDLRMLKRYVYHYHRGLAGLSYFTLETRP